MKKEGNPHRAVFSVIYYVLITIFILQSCVSTKKYDELIFEKAAINQTLAETQNSLKKLQDEKNALAAEFEAEKRRLNEKINTLEEQNNLAILKLEIAPIIPGGYKSDGLPREYLLPATNLYDVEGRINSVLRSQGYSNNRCFLVNGGFGIASDIESIKNDGTPLIGVDRFEKPTDLSKSEGSWFEKWWYGRKNRIRMFVFIVSNQPYNGANSKLSLDEIAEWRGSESKYNKISSKSVGNALFTPEYFCDVLVYEYEISDAYPKGKFSPSGYSVSEHLKKSKLWDVLSKAK